MNLDDFFHHKDVSLPISGFAEGTVTFDRFLGSVFDSYENLILQLNDPTHPGTCARVVGSIGSIRKLSSQIVSSVKHYLEGSPSKAYREIEKALIDQKTHTANMITTLKKGKALGSSAVIPLRGGDGFMEANCQPPLYRMREEVGAAALGALSGKEIFHVPFEKRGRVGNERYSIAGIPCLYLGSSTWACWDELGRPDLDRVFVSLFRFIEDTSVLDFQAPPLRAWEIFLGAQNELQRKGSTPYVVRYGEPFIESYLQLWPLIAACSVRTTSSKSSFYPQYIVPQMLLQWVCDEQKVDGIRYFSTRMPADALPFDNCAFPARNITHQGRCSYLSAKFTLTDPIAWSILREIDVHAYPEFGVSNYHHSIPVALTTQLGYDKTGFYYAERTLKFLEGEKPSFSKKVEP
jgi:hypothetical protein